MSAPLTADRERSALRTTATVAGAAGGALAATAALSSLGAAAYFARRALTPDRERPDDTSILAVDEGVVTLGVTPVDM